MRFVNPSMLIWAALVAVPVILYLVRPRPRAVRVTTLPFFMSLSRAAQESSWLRRLKQLLSLLISMLVIGCVVFALARLVVSPPADALKTVVLLVDRSASMAAATPGGGTHLNRGLRQMRDRLAGLPGSPSIVLMAYDRRPEIVLSRSRDARAIDRAIDQIVVRPVAGDTKRAMQLAVELAALETPAVVWHVTDHHADAKASQPDGDNADAGQSADPAADAKSKDPAEPTDPPASPNPPGVKIEEIIIGNLRPINAGITVLEVRRLPQQHSEFEAFAQVEAAVSETCEAELEVAIDGDLVDLRRLTLQPGKPERLVLPLKADSERDSVLSLRVKLSGDSLPLDDVAFARVPRARPLKVLWLSEQRSPFTELALSSLGPSYEVLVGKPKDWPTADPISVAIFDGWTPDPWPQDLPAVVINPQGSFGAVRVARLRAGGVPAEHVRAANLRHPILFGVATDRVGLLQTAVVDAGGLLEPLWISETAEPLLLAGQNRGQSLVVLAFDPAQSESLPLMASYPLLLGNAVNWAAQDVLRAESGRNHQTGDLVAMADGGIIRWTQPSPAGARKQEEQVSVPGQWCELDRTGVWQMEGGESGTASLLSSEETRLATEPEAVAAQAPHGIAWIHGDLTTPLLWCVCGMLLLESWMFHRKAVY